MKYGINILIWHILLFSLESIVVILPILQAVLIVHHVGKSRNYAQRKWSNKDTRLLCRLAAISLNSLMRFTCLLSQTFIALTISNSDTSSTYAEYIVLFILPVNSIFTPVIFTLSTCTLSPTIFGHTEKVKASKNQTVKEPKDDL